MVGAKFSSGISAYFRNDEVVVETIISKINTQYKEKGSASNFPVVCLCEPLCGRLKGWVGELPQQGFSRQIGDGDGLG